MSTHSKKRITKVSVIPIERVEKGILLIRNHRVLIDADLAELYGVTTKRLNEQVKRNKARFPKDFMFKLTKSEKQEVVANCDHLSRLKFSPVLPSAFTEHGAVMLAAVLNSPKAIEMSLFVVRAFVRLREILSTHKELAQKLKELELKMDTHDQQIQAIFDVINQLISPPEQQKRKMGFTIEE
ncbi:MAG: ORF6N domain-containing protein [Ignavibacteriales bacterium]